MTMTSSSSTTALYTIVYAGSAPRAYSLPARGQVYLTRDDALAALAAWRRAEPMAGTAEAAHAVSIRGPFRSRREVEEADVSETTAQTIERVSRVEDLDGSAFPRLVAEARGDRSGAVIAIDEDSVTIRPLGAKDSSTDILIYVDDYGCVVARDVDGTWPWVSGSIAAYLQEREATSNWAGPDA